MGTPSLGIGILWLRIQLVGIASFAIEKRRSCMSAADTPQVLLQRLKFQQREDDLCKNGSGSNQALEGISVQRQPAQPLVFIVLANLSDLHTAVCFWELLEPAMTELSTAIVGGLR